MFKLNTKKVLKTRKLKNGNINVGGLIGEVVKAGVAIELTGAIAEKIRKS